MVAELGLAFRLPHIKVIGSDSLEGPACVCPLEKRFASMIVESDVSLKIKIKASPCHMQKR